MEIANHKQKSGIPRKRQQNLTHSIKTSQQLTKEQNFTKTDPLQENFNSFHHQKNQDSNPSKFNINKFSQAYIDFTNLKAVGNRKLLLLFTRWKNQYQKIQYNERSKKIDDNLPLNQKTMKEDLSSDLFSEEEPKPNRFGLSFKLNNSPSKTIDLSYLNTTNHENQLSPSNKKQSTDFYIHKNDIKSAKKSHKNVNNIKSSRYSKQTQMQQQKDLHLFELKFEQFKTKFQKEKEQNPNVIQPLSSYSDFSDSSQNDRFNFNNEKFQKSDITNQNLNNPENPPKTFIKQNTTTTNNNNNNNNKNKNKNKNKS